MTTLTAATAVGFTALTGAFLSSPYKSPVFLYVAFASLLAALLVSMSGLLMASSGLAEFAMRGSPEIEAAVYEDALSPADFARNT